MVAFRGCFSEKTGGILGARGAAGEIFERGSDKRERKRKWEREIFEGIAQLERLRVTVWRGKV